VLRLIVTGFHARAREHDGVDAGAAVDTIVAVQSRAQCRIEGVVAVAAGQRIVAAVTNEAVVARGFRQVFANSSSTMPVVLSPTSHWLPSANVRLVVVNARFATRKVFDDAPMLNVIEVSPEVENPTSAAEIDGSSNCSTSFAGSNALTDPTRVLTIST